MVDIFNILGKKKMEGKAAFNLLGGNKRNIIIGDKITAKQRVMLRQNPFGNSDRDGVINGLDCNPFNPNEHQAVRLYRKWDPNKIRKESVPNKPGLYRFYDKDGQFLYVGHAKRLRHRLQSYYQKDCCEAHPTKVALRDKIAYVRITVTKESNARRLEKKSKVHAPHNHL
jgi:hypothetical protein